MPVWGSATRRVLLRSFAGAGAFGFGSLASHASPMRCEAREGSTEAKMKQNLARRLAKSYAAAAKVSDAELGVGDAFAFLPLSDTVYPTDCTPCIVTVSAPTKPVEVLFPDGSIHYVHLHDLHQAAFLDKIAYWQDTDPEMAAQIIDLLARARKGVIRL
eukprot:TRINITY_DN10818_c0_g1_i1.p1 TRINITY_DN10818_c0_g1~~TRINITY_DN10818_c0_g1_i1.p1  ORF type:complete len:159 (+),score=47.20 TRINITY_DN10818_c0_g1_i1:203-679(+)